MKQFWAVTVYDMDSRTLFRNETIWRKLIQLEGTADEPGRIDRCVLRADGTEWQGIELGADGGGALLVPVLPAVRADGALHRSQLAATRHREGLKRST